MGSVKTLEHVCLGLQSHLTFLIEDGKGDQPREYDYSLDVLAT